VRKIGRLLYARAQQAGAPERPRAPSQVAAEGPADDPALAEAFGALHRDLRAGQGQVGFGDWVALGKLAFSGGLSEQIRDSEPLPEPMLRQVHAALRSFLKGDRSQDLEGPVGPQGRQAAEILAASQGELDLVLMGHTHEPRRVGSPERPSYLNCGTWADRHAVPPAVLGTWPDARPAVDAFLHDLWFERLKPRPATWVELLLGPEGRLSFAALREVKP
jgi:hypothetical protein